MAVPAHRLWRGSLSCGRRASGRLPGPQPPFSACRGALRLYGGTVDHRHVGRSGICQRLEDAHPKPAPAPAVPSVVDRGRRAVDRRAILPTAARAKHMHDAADDAAIVHTPCSGLVPRQQWLDRRPSRIVEPVLRRHRCHPSRDIQLESEISTRFLALIGFRPYGALGVQAAGASLPTCAVMRV